jgi:hypothetical protein
MMNLELLGDFLPYELTRGFVLLADVERQPASFDGADCGDSTRGGVGVFQCVVERIDGVRCIIWFSHRQHRSERSCFGFFLFLKKR